MRVDAGGRQLSVSCRGTLSEAESRAAGEGPLAKRGDRRPACPIRQIRSDAFSASSIHARRRALRAFASLRAARRACRTANASRRWRPTTERVLSRHPLGGRVASSRRGASRSGDRRPRVRSGRYEATRSRPPPSTRVVAPYGPSRRFAPRDARVGRPMRVDAGGRQLSVSCRGTLSEAESRAAGEGPRASYRDGGRAVSIRQSAQRGKHYARLTNRFCCDSSWPAPMPAR